MLLSFLTLDHMARPLEPEEPKVAGYEGRGEEPLDFSPRANWYKRGMTGKEATRMALAPSSEALQARKASS